jgi:hypothetical protein
MAVALILSGCLGGDEEPRRVSGPPREVAKVVQQLEDAIAKRDFATVCDELFTAAARERAGAEDCESLTRSAADGVSRPRMVVMSIEIDGERARVEVSTRAAGQAEVPEVIELQREGGEWRVDSLAD